MNLSLQGNKINTKSDYNRIYLYDNIKFVAIFLVVIGHAIDFLTQERGNYLEKSLFLTIYSVHMPLFIFVSGLFVRPMDKSAKFPKQKVLSFILIGIAIRIFSSVLRLILGMKPKFAVFDMYDTYAWFMWAIAVFTVIVWVFRYCDIKILLIFSILLGIMVGYDKFLGDEFALMRIFVFLPFFIIGYMLSPENLAKIFSKRWLKIISFAVIVIILSCFFFDQHFYKYLRPMFTGRNNYYVFDDCYSFGFVFRIIAYVISGVLGFAVMCLVPDRNLGFFSSIGAKTLQIYFWHKMFLIVLEEFKFYDAVASLTGDIFATCIYVLTAIAITLICSIELFSFPTKQLLLSATKQK